MSDETVVAALLAGVGALEDTARAATSGPWKSSIEGRDHLGGDDVILTAGDDLYPCVTVDGRFNKNADNDQDYVAAVDPVFVLGLCAAIREVVELHTHSERDGLGVFCDYDGEAAPCPTLAALAGAFAGSTT